jgi:hypothetical protein
VLFIVRAGVRWSRPSWCFVERGQRKILVNYAKRQVGNKVYGGQSSHLPLEAEHGRCDSADFCVVASSFSRHAGGLGEQRRTARAG